MAECLNNSSSSHDKSATNYSYYDIDEDDDYEEFCEHFSFSVNFLSNISRKHFFFNQI